MGSRDEALVVPLRECEPQVDNDAPGYAPLRQATYLYLALCHDTMAAPSVRRPGDRDVLAAGIVEPDFSSVRPRLAAAWQQTGPATWEVELDAGRTDADGRPLTSQAVKWAFDRAFGLRNIAWWRWSEVGGLVSSDSVETVGETTLRFDLRAPDPHFPARFFSATPRLVDATAARDAATADDPWALQWMAEQPGGFGDHRMVDADQESATFRHRSSGDQTDAVRLEIVPDRESALTRLDEDRAVLVPGLRSDEIRMVESRFPDAGLIAAWAGHASIELDHSQPPFADERVRQALAYATPYAQVIDAGFLGLARPWRSPLKTYGPWYDDRAWDYRLDLRSAKDLLRQAGLADGFSTELYIPDRADGARIGGLLVDAYAAVGVEVKLLDLAQAAAGWMPPMHLRLDCGHNITEPLYDLAHDVAAVTPIVGDGAQRVGTNGWHPRYVPDADLLMRVRRALTAATAQERHAEVVGIQRRAVAGAFSIHLGEQVLANAVSASTPAAYRDVHHRLQQVTLFQNANTGYIGTTGTGSGYA